MQTYPFDCYYVTFIFSFHAFWKIHTSNRCTGWVPELMKIVRVTKQWTDPAWFSLDGATINSIRETLQHLSGEIGACHTSFVLLQHELVLREVRVLKFIFIRVHLCGSDTRKSRISRLLKEYTPHHSSISTIFGPCYPIWKSIIGMRFCLKCFIP